MSKATFWQDVEDTAWHEQEVRDIKDLIWLIEKHGGAIVWPSEPKEPPQPAVCTCHDDLKRECDNDFSKSGPWHSQACLFRTPF